MPRLVKFTCPYCETINKHYVDLEPSSYRDRFVRFCDVEEGGCEKMVVLEVEQFINVKVYEVKE
ncbi:MAG: hypothetical protein ACXADB_11585 [Candidatus Hermodarchaeia archaeon]